MVQSSRIVSGLFGGGAAVSANEGLVAQGMRFTHWDWRDVDGAKSSSMDLAIVAKPNSICCTVSMMLAVLLPCFRRFDFLQQDTQVECPNCNSLAHCYLWLSFKISLQMDTGTLVATNEYR